MTEWERVSSGDPEDDPAVAKVAERLARSRPAPGAALRGGVRAFLAGVDTSGLLVGRPKRLWLRFGFCVSAGGVVLALVAAGVAGWGPFAA